MVLRRDNFLLGIVNGVGSEAAVLGRGDPPTAGGTLPARRLWLSLGVVTPNESLTDETGG